MGSRRRSTEELLNLMKDPESLRCVGLVGHIDHGKTTLSDSLLAEAGLLNESLVGEARALDYLEEEQRRGITMKSANVSLYYEKGITEKPFLINLVDTPGHLDFSGKVTRALRLIDGVVVIVDAVEEINSQSEIVVKQALEEAVRPDARKRVRPHSFRQSGFADLRSEPTATFYIVAYWHKDFLKTLEGVSCNQEAKGGPRSPGASRPCRPLISRGHRSSGFRVACS